MNAKKNDLPIDGFYKDERTGKYFRIPPGGAENPSFKKIKQGIPEHKQYRTLSVVTYLKGRETGFLHGLNDIYSFYNTQLIRRNLVIEETLQQYVNDIDSVEFIKGGTRSLFGMWSNKDNSSKPYVLGKVPYHDFDADLQFGFLPSSKYITDMCEGAENSVIYVYNHPVKCQGYVEVMWCQNGSRHSYNIYDHIHSTSLPLFCCSHLTSFEGYYLALGSIDNISIYCDSSLRHVLNCKGRVQTVVFAETGQSVISGLHNGTLILHDPRASCAPQTQMKISMYGIIDSLFVQPQQVIVAGLNNELCTVDLRSQKVVTHFNNHKHGTKKLPFNSVNGYLGATGSDNIFRIWNLSGGLPIWETRPLYNPRNKLRGWLSAEGSKTYWHAFENDKVNVYEI